MPEYKEGSAGAQGEERSGKVDKVAPRFKKEVVDDVLGQIENPDTEVLYRILCNLEGQVYVRELLKKEILRAIG